MKKNRKMEEKIMYDSDRAAIYEERVLKGWWSREKGVSEKLRYWGEDEHMARWSGCTHMTCECGDIHEKSRLKCPKCIAKSIRERYEKLEKVIWDGESPICLYDGDEYFFSQDDLEYYCESNRCNISDLMLVLCKPIYPRQVDEDYWCDELAEDGELPDEIIDALKVFNDVLANSAPLSWIPGTKRVNMEKP